MASTAAAAAKPGKVKRYQAGVRPEFGGAGSDSSDDDSQPHARPQTHTTMPPTAALAAAGDDPRLRRLQNLTSSGARGAAPSAAAAADDNNWAAKMARHRQIHGDDAPEQPQAGVVLRRANQQPVAAVLRRGADADDTDSAPRRPTLAPANNDDDEDDEEAVARRRQRARQSRDEEEELLKADQAAGDEAEQGGQDEADEESEYESYTDESGSEEDAPRFKPTFIPKAQRITVVDAEQLEAEQRLKEEKEAELAAKRVQESKQLVEIILRKEQLEADVKVADVIDDRDLPADQEMDIEAWKVRELLRMKRDRQERETYEREQEDIERRRNMTDAERAEDDRNNGKVVTNEVQRGQQKFLQKYYHRGAFYLDKDEEVLKRDTTAPTLEDHFDRSILPKVMQVKNFGRAGRTKYTHLRDQDTTLNTTVPWHESETVSKRTTEKQGGMKQVFDRPGKKSK